MKSFWLKDNHLWYLWMVRNSLTRFARASMYTKTTTLMVRAAAQEEQHWKILFINAINFFWHLKMSNDTVHCAAIPVVWSIV